MTMTAVCLHDKQEIEAFLRGNTYLHLYEIGDLDDFFWQYTTWYALKEEQSIAQVALLYSAPAMPVLLGISDEPTDRMQTLLRSIIHLLPTRFYAHLSGNLATVFADDYRIISHGLHYKMALVAKAPMDTIDDASVVSLSVADLPELEALYRASYPGNSFDPRMLETGRYYGTRAGASIISVAGIHVYSPRFRVAVLGNVTTHPAYRGRGLGTAACAKLCKELLREVEHVGLNVKADNASAIACYERLGFERIATYEEYSLELKGT
jgi:ribosomal protein S18 acetylase RimI-like enzyme